MADVEKKFGASDVAVIELKRILLRRIADLENADTLTSADPSEI
jgi:hypothetical protein